MFTSANLPGFSPVGQGADHAKYPRMSTRAGISLKYCPFRGHYEDMLDCSFLQSRERNSKGIGEEIVRSVRWKGLSGLRGEYEREDQGPAGGTFLYRVNNQNCRHFGLHCLKRAAFPEIFCYEYKHLYEWSLWVSATRPGRHRPGRAKSGSLVIAAESVRPVPGPVPGGRWQKENHERTSNSNRSPGQ